MSARSERNIVELERAQFGVASTSQLHDNGLSDQAIYRRVAASRHDRLRRGVVANPGVDGGIEQHITAAVLAGGDEAFASHESGLCVWDMLRPTAALIEITTPLARRVRLKGVRCHRSSLLVEAKDVCIHRGIRVSTPERTIVDVSGRFDLKMLGRIVDDALRRRLTTYARLVETAERLPPAPGRSQKKMFSVLAGRSEDVARHESHLEDFVFEALKRFKLPLPRAQYKVVVKGRERRIDHCYVEPRIAIEALGFDVRRQRGKFDDEALRGNELQLADFKLLQFTSAFTDWQIACHVAEALALPTPARPRKALAFLEWSARRDGLGSTST
jgi:hypothetical protein